MGLVTRPLVQQGFPGPGQEVFPEQAREQGRRLGLGTTDDPLSEATVLRANATNAGGVTKTTWTPDVDAVRARIDPGGAGTPGVRGDTMDESSTHVITFDQEVTLTTKDRVSIDGATWIVTAVEDRTDKLVQRAEVRAV